MVQAAGLAKRYGDVVALRSLDLQVPRNSLFGFLGPNGAGKTTAMRLLLGLTAPTSGSATVFGLDVVRDSAAIRRRVGYLPQQPRFYDDLTPRQTLRYARGFFPPDPGRPVGAEIDEVLELVGLTDKRDQPVGGLSGGQRQRLGIAQAQIHRPELLILDEPASALDPLGRRDVLEVMRRLKETTTVFYSTHILDDVQRVSDTVAILKDGERIAQAPIAQLLAGSSGARYDVMLRVTPTRLAPACSPSTGWSGSTRCRWTGSSSCASGCGTSAAPSSGCCAWSWPTSWWRWCASRPPLGAGGRVRRARRAGRVVSPLSVGGVWRAGLGNQTRREASMWWATTRWWRQSLVWAVLLGGLFAGVLWVIPALMAGVDGSDAAAVDVVQGAAQFAELAAFVTAVGVVILTQGVLLDEQRSGLHEWLLSKPLSRPALVLAKFAGHASGLLVALVLAPWAGIYVLLSIAAGQPWPLGRFLGTVALVGLFVLFHLALVLALSALFGSRGAVLAIPLVLLVGADLLVAAAPWAADGLPYLLNRVAAALLATGELTAVGPAVATGVATAVLAAVAVWRFNRQEL